MRSKTGGSSVGATLTVPVVRSKLPAWAAFFTFTANVCGVLKSPEKSSVNAAALLFAAAPDNLLMDTFGIAVTSSKSEAVTPLPKAVPLKATLTVAVSRVPSVSDTGFVDEIEASLKLIEKLSLSWSLSARSESASCAMITILWVPKFTLGEGVPQIVRGVVPGQVPLPVRSVLSPDGRPWTKYVMFPLPPLAAGNVNALKSESAL